ncbi:MAG: histidine phosphatase family protein [Actinobacteria bacterium]|nr:histidine phosphatase family protein [Actinomycetota bacterium]
MTRPPCTQGCRRRTTSAPPRTRCPSRRSLRSVPRRHRSVGAVARLLLVRHGQSTWNAEHRWQGHSDPPLSDLGERQARLAATAVVALDIHALFSSDLQRARQTAALLAPPDLDAEVVPAVKERTVGEWEGLTRTEIEERYPGMLGSPVRPPGFESDEALITRVRPALESLAERVGDRAALVVTHGGVIRSLERLFESTPDVLPNLGGRWFVVIGDTLELGEPEVLIDPHDVALTAPREE